MPSDRFVGKHSIELAAAKRKVYPSHVEGFTPVGHLEYYPI
jgi:hypothetical protein